MKTKENEDGVKVEGRTNDQIFAILEDLESEAPPNRLRMKLCSVIELSSRILTKMTAISGLIERIKRRLTEGVMYSFASRRSSLAVHAIWQSTAAFAPLA